MPSPFPGMDPFLEGQVWTDHHLRLIAEISDALVQRVRPRYVVRVEERVYVEHNPDDSITFVRPDVAVLEHEGREEFAEGNVAVAAAVEATPVLLTLPLPERRREAYLTIRERETMELTTIIEVLSPGNKRPGSDGRREYLSKREAVLQSATHLVELDLLRAGERLPTVEPLPSADYYVFVARRQRRPKVEVYPWTLRQRLPCIPVPLAEQDPDVKLDVQSIFNALYDRAGYDYSLDYRRPVQPPLCDEDAAWVQERLAALSLAT